MDDKFYISNYSLEGYEEAFPGGREGQNSIGSIMSAMVSQIAYENSYQEVFEQHQARLH